MQIELQNLQRNIGITFLLVTHDQEEALSMSDEVCIMREGKIVQAGSPRDLYDEPVDRYVADFVGRSNFFAGRAGTASDGTIPVTLANGFACAGRAPRTAAAPRPGDDIVLSIRPEQVVMAAKAADLPQDATARLDVVLRNRIFLGEHIEYLVEHPTLGEFLVLIPRQADQGDRHATGDTVSVGWRPKAALVLRGTAAQV
jgi:spermidine/putrescine transport system ATP-binding protein